MSEIIRPFNIMAKPVCGVCNLDCGYCYYKNKPQELYPGVRKFQMSEQVLETYTRQYMETMPLHCDFGWQGGEPLLAGMEFFQKAVSLQKQFGREGQVVANAVQTNGTLLDDKWCEFLAANKFLIGLSLDGPPQWHDSFRKDHAGRPSAHLAYAGMDLLRKHRVEFNVLVTLNSANATHAGDVYRYFVNRGVNYVQFIPVLEWAADDRPESFSCTAEQFGRFMLEVFDLWAARDAGRISERFIDNVLHNLLFGKAALCCYAERCANAHVLEWNGDLYACDHFVFKQWRIGNIMERPLAELVRDPKLEEFAALKTTLPAKCRDCEYLEYCHGGCPKHHRPIGTDPNRVNFFCEGYKLFFRHALPELKRMAEYFRQGRTPPPKSAASIAARPPAQPGTSQHIKSPGRNDPCTCGSGLKFKNCCGRK